MAGSYRPSRETLRIGGDFYDTYPAEDSDGESTVVLGDVCGKGLEAAVLTGKIRNTLSALRLVETDHVRLLTLLNHALLNTAHARFATMVLAGVTPLGRGQVRLRLTTGGHPAPLILRVSGDVEEAGTSGTLIGAVPDVRATTFTTVLQPGESCLLYSDGVTEARGGVTGREFFGPERLKTTVVEAASACRWRPWSSMWSCAPPNGSPTVPTTTSRWSAWPPRAAPSECGERPRTVRAHGTCTVSLGPPGACARPRLRTVTGHTGVMTSAARQRARSGA